MRLCHHYLIVIHLNHSYHTDNTELHLHLVHHHEDQSLLVHLAEDKRDILLHYLHDIVGRPLHHHAIIPHQTVSHLNTVIDITSDLLPPHDLVDTAGHPLHHVGGNDDHLHITRHLEDNAKDPSLPIATHHLTDSTRGHHHPPTITIVTHTVDINHHTVAGTEIHLPRVTGIVTAHLEGVMPLQEDAESMKVTLGQTQVLNDLCNPKPVHI